MVISGTLGAGKTHTAGAVRDLLVARGERCAVIDVDWLCQADPAPDDDPYNNRLAFANLEAVWPNYAIRGVEYLVLARVVEDEEDRNRYCRALPGAEVRIVRVEASRTTRADRLVAREPEGLWRDGHLARTDVLGERLAAIGLDDLVVSNEQRSGEVVAAEILSGLGW